MTNLELADKLQNAASNNYGDMCGMLWDAGAALRNLHTENTALRVTEDNLRQELRECQDQRRAAFRRIEELDRELKELRSQIGQGVPVAWYDEDMDSSYTAGELDGGKVHGLIPLYTHPAPQASAVQQEAATAWQSIEAVAAQRYKVGLAHDSMFYRHAVVAGDGSQQLYIGRKTECENMARKFAGAFLDGAYLANLYTHPAPQQKPLTDEQIDDARVMTVVYRNVQMADVQSFMDHPKAVWFGWCHAPYQRDDALYKLNKAVAAKKPLTDEQIVDAYCKERGMRQYVEAYVAGARFAEAAHNIGEKK